MQIVMRSRSNNKCKKGKFHWQINCSWGIIHPAAEGREKSRMLMGRSKDSVAWSEPILLGKRERGTAEFPEKLDIP